MGRFWVRLFMAVVGIVAFTVYTAGAIGGLLLVQWLFRDPPSLLTLLVSLPLVVLVAGYLGYRVGTLRLLASLDGLRLSPNRAPQVYRRLERLCTRMNVREPPLVVAQLGAPNALSIGGPRKGVVVVDRSLLGLLTIDELEGILAHELAHMENYDTFLNTLALTAARTVVGLVSLFFLPLVLFLVGIDRAVAWISGTPSRQFGLGGQFQRTVTLVLGAVFGLFTLAFLAYSRKREFAADRRAADVTGKPVALARGLAKIHRETSPREGLLSFLYTHDEPRERDRRWLSTHPPVEDRIERLLERGEHAGQRHHIGRIQP